MINDIESIVYKGHDPTLINIIIIIIIIIIYDDLPILEILLKQTMSRESAVYKNLYSACLHF